MTHREKEQKRKTQKKERGVVMFKCLLLVVTKSGFLSPLLITCLLKSCLVYGNPLPSTLFFTKLAQTRFPSFGHTYCQNTGPSAI